MSSEIGVYPVQAYHSSHDTVNTIGESSGSHSTEQWGNSTDPSSENSSIDRVHAVKHDGSGDAYGGGMYGRGSPIRGDAIREESWHGSQLQYQESYRVAPPPMQHPAMKFNQGYTQPPQGYAQPTHGYAQPPQLVQRPEQAQRPVIRLGDGSGVQTSAPNGPVYPGARPRQESGGEAKKGGWLKKRFSKNG